MINDKMRHNGSLNQTHIITSKMLYSTIFSFISIEKRKI